MNLYNTLNGRVKIGDKVYQVAGGGGGGGNFAIIQISCPPETKVRVTHNGKYQTQIVTSGIWLYGCKDAGEYIVSIVNTSTSQTVTITEQGQVESVYVSEQVINNQFLYLFGNEYTDITGGWTPYMQALPTPAGYYGAFFKTNTIDFTQYKYLFTCGRGWKLNPNDITFYFNIPYGTFLQQTNDVSTKFQIMDLNAKGVSKINTIGIGVKPQSTYGKDLSSYYRTSGIDVFYKQANRMWWSSHNSSRVQVGEYNVFGIGLCNDDDISVLSDYGSNITEILSNSFSLFQDRESLKKMVKKLTGYFMISALNNSTFITEMNNSENKDILQANEVWSQFLSLITA